MKIVVAGGSGFLGRALVASLRRRSHRVHVLTRRSRHEGDVVWTPGVTGAWTLLVEAADVVVNLAGEPLVGPRWSPGRKAVLRSSRIETTRALARVLAAAPRPPVFISGSAVGIYGDRGEEVLTEASSPGGGFLADLCVEWEHAAAEGAIATRVVLLRTGIVLSRGGGALPKLARPFHFFAGGPVGSGRQYLSWIHIDDWIAMTEWVMTNAAAAGPVNAVAPGPVTSAGMAAALGRTLRRPSIMRVPAFPLRVMFGEMADAALLSGQRVLPDKAQALGFAFRYATIESALSAIYR